MGEVWQGTLARTFKGDKLVGWKLVGENQQREPNKPLTVSPKELAESLTKFGSQTVPVDYEFEQGHPCRVRARGEAWSDATSMPWQPPRDQGRGGERPTRAGQGQRPQANPGPHGNHANPPILPGEFYNPYNFIPAPPPEGEDGNRKENPLGRCAPIGHDRYHEDCFSGSIDIEIETETPLLIPDTSSVEIAANDHQTFPLLVDHEDKPVLRPTALKGCLRSSYEAITNSRFGVFQGHDRPFVRRKSDEKVPDEKSPTEFLHPNLRPGRALEELSPADRVFGWVRQSKKDDEGRDAKGAWRGQLRIAWTRCKTPAKDAVEYFEDSDQRLRLSLAILSAPKPKQVRFYLAKDKKGAPLEPRDDATYKDDGQRSLRGRKVYPHHNLAKDYWENPLEIIRQSNAKPEVPQQRSNRYLEYVRVAPDKEILRDDQNRSMTGWVKRDTKFSARIEVVNLSNVELGAWHCHGDSGLRCR